MSATSTSQTIERASGAKDVLYGLPEGQDARVLIEKARASMVRDAVHIHMALDDTRVSFLKEAVAFFDPEVEIAVFPAWDCLPYDRVSPASDIVAERVACLCRLMEWAQETKRVPRLLLTTVNAALQNVMPQSALLEAAFSVRKGGRLNLEGLQSYLAANGYHRTGTVREPGEFALRGGIVDLFPAGFSDPVRIDLFGDEVESLRVFDPLSQISGDNLDHFALTPVTEYFLSQNAIDRFRKTYRELFPEARFDSDPLYQAVTEGRRYNGADHWLPLFYERMESLFDYAADATLTSDYHAIQAQNERLTQIADFYETRKSLEAAALQKKTKRGGDDAPQLIYHPIPPALLYANGLITEGQEFSPFADPSRPDDAKTAKKARDFADIRALPDGNVFAELKTYLASLRGEGRKIAIAAFSEGSRDRMKALLDAEKIPNLKICESFAAVKKLLPSQIGLVVLGLEDGFVADDIAILSEEDILGDRLSRALSKKTKKKSDNFLREASSLAPGDLVVHIDHGLGRFEGLETLKVGGQLHDCLKVVYEGGDKLFVPIENIEVLSRYGEDTGTAHLDRMGGAGWQARKAKVKKDLLRIAAHLMEIAAQRLLKKGEVLNIPESDYARFTAGFPYAETDDQLRAITEVITDMESGKPMDRLICGDVGFGKTEVALRAAYVAAMAGKQVALIAPTTLLARQHYQNFSERFKGTGLRVGHLSRLVSAREAKATHDELEKGTLSIVIGTHSILARGMKFANLGLMIVDEEQRFGVKQKERLKELKENVHVLTLTATPIPRTLQMSLTGVKDMSIIATPPVDRLAIRTFVLPFDPMVVREALLREHYRGGQSFYVCPRIKDLNEVEETLRELVPEVRLVVAHGQMPPAELEERMNAFIDKQFDVLLATNIIESGIDIPTANTMIVHRSDMFGLAQLYQIRGRIGRSKVRAYAYLTTDPAKVLTEQAARRLEVLEQLDMLGAGFQLASHDMDIRGAGNLLGEEQSGHVREVGIELYQQMLEEAVAAAKSGVAIEDIQLEGAWSPQINLGSSILIPERYVADLSVRMNLYKRLSELEDEGEVEAFAAEMIDRFGRLPSEVENLLDIVKIKQLCKRANIDRVDVGPKGALLGFHQDRPANPEKLLLWMAEKSGLVKLRPDQKISVLKAWHTDAQRIAGTKSLLAEIASLS
ncbi:MAG: transcription-repair coupling factor [Pseudobdellovibrionaceae bacterium]